MKKETLVERIIAALRAEQENYARAARAAHAEATDGQSKAENKYDTRGLEASYLARAQSEQAAEVVEAIRRYEALEVRAFAPDEAIAIGALVEVERRAGQVRYFMGPAAGGTEVEDDGPDGLPILVITPQSPVGKLLLGRQKGERVEFQAGCGKTEAGVVRSVS